MLTLKKSDRVSGICQKAIDLSVGKTYSFKFRLKLTENTGTRVVGYAGISETEPDSRYGNITLPKAYAFYSLGGGSFAYDRALQKGRLAYNGECDWIDYEVRFVATQPSVFFYIENSENVQDILVDAMEIRESQHEGRLGIALRTTKEPVKNILLIGNSYSCDAVRELMGARGTDGIISAGNTHLRFGCLYTGGQTFSYFHNQIYMDASSMSFKYYAKGDSAIQTAVGVSFGEVLALTASINQKWDYIVVQAATNSEWGQFAEKGSSKIKDFCDYIRLIKSKSEDSEIVIYGTWSGSEAFNAEKAEHTGFKTQAAQHEAIMASIDNIKAETGCRVINMEKLFHDIRSDKSLEIGDAGLNRDGYHLNGRGTTLVGLTLHEYFTAESAVDIAWNKFKFGSYGVQGAETTLTEAQLKSIKLVAHNYCSTFKKEDKK